MQALKVIFCFMALFFFYSDNTESEDNIGLITFFSIKLFKKLA